MLRFVKSLLAHDYTTFLEAEWGNRQHQLQPSSFELGELCQKVCAILDYCPKKPSIMAGFVYSARLSYSFPQIELRVNDQKDIFMKVSIYHSSSHQPGPFNLFKPIAIWICQVEIL